MRHVCPHGRVIPLAIAVSGHVRVPGGTRRNSPRLCTSTIRTVFIKIACILEQSGTVGVPLALDWESLINVLTLLKKGEETFPESASFPGMQKCMGVAD